MTRSPRGRGGRANGPASARPSTDPFEGVRNEPHDPILQREFWRAPIPGSPLRLVHST